MRPSALLALTLLGFSFLASPAVSGEPATYGFTLNSAASGFNANLSFSATTSGTLIGSWDPNSNPTGTRTKPGWWGPFGDDENVAVAVNLAGNVGGGVQTHPTGAFTLSLDPGLGIVVASGFAADLLGGDPASLPATTTLETEAFRTRNPSSLYPGGVPFEVPIGSATLSLLAIQQTGDAVPGVLTPTGPNEYSFIVTPLVNLSATLDLLGNPIEVPPTLVPFPLQGQIVVNGETALLTALQPFDFSQTQPVGQALPQSPLDIPTLIPPGETAHILMNLTLDEVAASLAGSNSFVADGVLIPEPAAGLVLLLVAALGGLRNGRGRMSRAG